MSQALLSRPVPFEKNMTVGKSIEIPPTVTFPTFPSRFQHHIERTLAINFHLDEDFISVKIKGHVDELLSAGRLSKRFQTSDRH
jgi:hypothetical protein